MDFQLIFNAIVAAMFSPPGIANFVVCTVVKKRLHATGAALVAGSALVFMNQDVLSKIDPTKYTMIVIGTVIGMMIASHLAFTIGEKVIRKQKSED